MGVFDKNSLKYNDAIPNLNKEDGIDNVKCDNTECNCRDSRGYCLYETCVINLFNKIKYHSKFKHKCSLCNQDYEKLTENSVPGMDLSYYICPECLSKLRNIVK